MDQSFVIHEAALLNFAQLNNYFILMMQPSNFAEFDAENLAIKYKLAKMVEMVNFPHQIQQNLEEIESK